MSAATRRRFHAGFASLAAPAAFTAAFAGACTVTTSLDGLSSGGSPVIPEGGAPDTSTPVDAAPEAAVDTGTDAAPVDPCAGSVFCDRFERSDVEGTWDYLEQFAGGTLSIDSSTSTSATRSLLMTIPSGTAPRAWLSFGTTTTNHRHGRIDWSSLSDAQPNREAQLMRIQLESSQRKSFVFVSLVPGENIVLAEQREEAGVNSSTTYSNVVLDKVFAPGKWQRWSMELDASTSPPKARVTVDGVVVGTKNLLNPFDTGVLRVLLGATYVRDGTLRKVWYDDVALFALD